MAKPLMAVFVVPASCRHLCRILLLPALLLLTACATTPIGSTDPDALEGFNRPAYNFTDGADRYLIKPVAETYATHTPRLVRAGITNFFNNLLYLNVMVNSFLQGKIGQGFSDATRIVANTTIGLGGLVDVATPIGLPSHDEDFGQTLAVWGAGQGSYLFLPLLGPNTTRDTPDLAMSTLLNPLIYIKAAIALPLAFLNGVNTRANLLSATALRDENAVDPYIFTREAYLQQRRDLIFDGNAPTEGIDDMFDFDDED
ncbi:MAG: VacJ family lipoprotein [Pseudomonadales bacterium]|nr:VacJ family lipoprotein [Pseudomonadales bacterium]